MTTRQKLSSTSIAILALLAAAATCQAQAVDVGSHRPERSGYTAPRAGTAVTFGAEQAAARTPFNILSNGAERVLNIEREAARPRLSLKAFRGWEQLNGVEKERFFQRQLGASQNSLSVAGEQFHAGGDGRASSGVGKRLVFVPSRGPIPLGQWINYGGAPDWNREHLTQTGAQSLARPSLGN